MSVANARGGSAGRNVPRSERPRKLRVDRYRHDPLSRPSTLRQAQGRPEQGRGTTALRASGATSRGAVRADGKHKDPKNRRSEGCHASPPLAACLQRSHKRRRERESSDSLSERRGLAGPRCARSSEPLIQKHKHPGKSCLCFWISASLCRRPQAGDPPAPQRDPPIFDSSVLRIFLFTVGALSGTANVRLSARRFYFRRTLTTT